MVVNNSMVVDMAQNGDKVTVVVIGGMATHHMDTIQHTIHTQVMVILQHQLGVDVAIDMLLTRQFSETWEGKIIFSRCLKICFLWRS